MKESEKKLLAYIKERKKEGKNVFTKAELMEAAGFIDERSIGYIIPSMAKKGLIRLDGKKIIAL